METNSQTSNVEKLRQKEHDDAMEVAEEARESEWTQPSFAAGLFMGKVDPDLIFPYPQPTEEQRIEGEAFLKKIEAFMKEKVDPEANDRDEEIPDHVFQGLAELGCFGMKIPKKYGGLGLSQVYYNKTISLIGSYCGSTAVWLSAHQSIGVPQPLKLFGTKAQKEKYLPRFAKGEISAFALTEPGVGSDPAKMTTTAEPTEDGKHFILNGEKLWCTNVTRASTIVVMARTPDKIIKGKPRKQITAFIVEKDMPGYEVIHRCQFMGLKSIGNGLVRFTNVKVPRENIILAEGKGLKLALTTLNNGRLTLPAACTGATKLCLNVARDWSNERVQWGAPVGKHEAVASKLGWIAAVTYAMESATYYASALADKGTADIRLEAAMAKMFASEESWRAIDETLQVRGGRGYETETSLKRRGEKGYAVERMMRDARINMIIEGSSEIMRLFLAREALDPHMKLGGDLLNPRAPLGKKITAFVKATLFYAWWYPSRWIPTFLWKRHGQFGPFAKHMRFVERASRRLARNIFHGMMRYQAGLERRQMFLGRIVDVGTELFNIASTVSRAITELKQNPSDRSALALADLYCRRAKSRIQDNFRGMWHNEDALTYKVAQSYLKGDYLWLEEGIIKATEVADQLQAVQPEIPTRAAS